MEEMWNFALIRSGGKRHFCLGVNKSVTGHKDRF